MRTFHENKNNRRIARPKFQLVLHNGVSLAKESTGHCTALCHETEGQTATHLRKPNEGSPEQGQKHRRDAIPALLLRAIQRRRRETNKWFSMSRFLCSSIFISHLSSNILAASCGHPFCVHPQFNLAKGENEMRTWPD